MLLWERRRESLDVRATCVCAGGQVCSCSCVVGKIVWGNNGFYSYAWCVTQHVSNEIGTFKSCRPSSMWQGAAAVRDLPVSTTIRHDGASGTSSQMTPRSSSSPDAEIARAMSA